MALTQLKTSGIADDAVTEDKIADAINTARAANTAKDLTALSAANLTSGTIPDARFPATLPAASGINLTNVPARTNLVINGAMQVAQRATSSTTSGYGTVDRWQVAYGNTDNAITQEQVDVASGTTPYSLGFRKALKATNGNQTSGAANNVQVVMYHKIEAQDIANSGWNYTDPNSKITLSYWVKSSVAQNFYVRLTSIDGTLQNFPSETGSLTANTWTKVTKTISGNSNLTFDNNTDQGLQVLFDMFYGTDYTDSSVSLDTWAAYASGTRSPDQTSTWYTTNNATFEVTGVQLEVGSSASPFAHQSYADTLAKCQRYLYKLEVGKGGGTTFNNFIVMARYSTSTASTPYGSIFFPVEMRTEPTFSYVGTALGSAGYAGNPIAYATGKGMATIKGTNTVAAGGILYCRVGASGDLDLFFSAEL